MAADRMPGSENGSKNDHHLPSSTDRSGVTYSNNDPNSTDNFQGFIVSEYARQMRENESDEVDAERTQSFFERALGETQRMNREVEKSKNKRDKLYEEFSSDKFRQWQDEHAEVVLPSDPQKSDH
ncbi:uncharacterized protein LOC141899341 [Tubulanus polymorphus]|uniref:uncharacterized protein LOC141899341 n=1 Tax=Tubulanus polymorphus TaxID=672921 RepID=UPI003DA3584D